MPLLAAPGFWSTRNATEPAPLPEAPAVITIHGTLLVADHAQPLVVVTATVVPVPPAAPIDCGVASTE
jgi:hypothetical protein